MGSPGKRAIKRVCVCVCTLILNGRVKELVECLAKLGSSGKWMVSQCVCVCVY